MLNSLSPIELLGIIVAIGLPFFNIPLVLRIRNNKSSHDISIIWTLGIYTGFILLLPPAYISSDPVFRASAIMNVLSFTVVIFYVIKYRRA